MKYFILLLISTFYFQLSSQYSVDWGKMIGSRMIKSTMDIDSNIYIAGNFDYAVDFDPGPGFAVKSPFGGTDFYVVKLNKKGIYQWVRNFGTDSCTICHDRVSDISVDGNGNVVLTGDFFGPMDFDPHPVNTFMMRSGSSITVNYVLKLDSLGNFVWAKQFRNNIASSGDGKININERNEIYYTISFMDSIDADPTNGILYFTTQSSGSENTLIAKLKPNGSLSWAKSLKGTYNTIDNFIVKDTHNLLITGKYRGMVDFDMRNSITNSLNSGSATHSYLLKVSHDTIFEFIKDFSTTGNGLNTKDIFSSSDSSILLCGNFSGTVDFDPGSAVLSKTSVITSGDAYILKLTSAGDYSDIISFGGTGIYQNYCKTIKEDSLGSLYFAGDYMSTVDFDKGIGIVNHTSVGDVDAFVLKTNPNLDYLNSFSIGGNKWELIEDIYVNSNHIFLLGNTSSTSGDFDPSSSTFPIVIPAGSVHANFTLKLKNTITSHVSLASLNKDDFKIYPNPAINYLIIEGIKGSNSIRIYSSMGKIIRTKDYIGSQEKIDISSLAKGIYTIMIINSDSQNKIFVKKIIKL